MRAAILGDTFDPGAVPTIDPAIAVTMEVDRRPTPRRPRPACCAAPTRHRPGRRRHRVRLHGTNAAAHTEPSIGLTQPAPGIVRYRLAGDDRARRQIKAFDVRARGSRVGFAALRGRATSRDGAACGRLRSSAPSATGRNPLDIVDAQRLGHPGRQSEQADRLPPAPAQRTANADHDPVIEQQLRDYAKGGAEAGTAEPAAGATAACRAELAWESPAEAGGLRAVRIVSSRVLGRELGDAAFNDPRFPRWDERSISPIGSRAR